MRRPMRSRLGQSVLRCGLAVSVLCSGCLRRDESISYPFHDSDVQYYKDVAEEIAYPAIDSGTPDAVAYSQSPHTVLDTERSEVWEMTLMEAVHLALQNNDVIRSAGTFLSPGNPILANGQNAASVFDPAINESGVLFGNRGVEAALSAFDAQLAASMIWGRNEQIQNNSFFGGGLMPGAVLTTETGNFDGLLRKDFAYGGQVQLRHAVNYLGNDAPGQLFPSAYSGMVQALYRQPLWAGAGTEYTRIAGPITQQFGGLSGVTQGVVIARINNDISIADFEASIRDLVRDVQDTYWDLYLAYRNFDTAVITRNSALGVWQKQKARVEIGGGIENPADFSQAEDQYFTAEALVENSRSNIFTAETRLRRLLGLPVNEGRVIRPAEEPVTAEIVPDWQTSLTDALVHRVELRKQKWNIKSLDLQLIAAESLTKPRLDFVGGYQVNGFGDQLLAYNDNDGISAQGLNSYYETLTQGNQTGWTLGFEFNMPIGFRSAHAQVRNIELRLAKAQQVLYTQELEIAHELAAAFQELTRAYASAQAQFSRRAAAIENERVYTEQELGGAGRVDEILRAQERRARAEVDFFTALVDYNKALTNYQYRKGTLLQDTGVSLRENGWTPEAYVDAYRLAQARTAAIDAPFKHAEPAEFASPSPVDGVEFAHPAMPTPAADELPAAPAFDDDVDPQINDEMEPLLDEPKADRPFDPLLNDSEPIELPQTRQLPLGTEQTPFPAAVETPADDGERFLPENGPAPAAARRELLRATDEISPQVSRERRFDDPSMLRIGVWGRRGSREVATKTQSDIRRVSGTADQTSPESVVVRAAAEVSAPTTGHKTVEIRRPVTPTPVESAQSSAASATDPQPPVSQLGRWRAIK